MTLQGETVAAAPLVGGGSTTLHSHAGGGGADIKSGSTTAAWDGGTPQAVTFNTAFSSTPNVVVGFGENEDAVDVPYVVDISPSGFKVGIIKGHGGSTHTWVVQWVATNAGNP